MKKKTESKTTVMAAEAKTKTENPIQERHIGEVAESIEATAEDVLTARRLEACAERGRSIRDQAGSVFVP